MVPNKNIRYQSYKNSLDLWIQEMVTRLNSMEEAYNRTRAQSRKDAARVQELALRTNCRDRPGIILGFDIG